MPMKKHLNIKVYGRVQGVFFRHSAKQKARELGVKGFVRNEPDNTVYIEAEGEEENLKQFLDWCHKGPFLASVKKVEVKESEMKNFNDFVIL
jgi:acylphosphatase